MINHYMQAWLPPLSHVVIIMASQKRCTRGRETFGARMYPLSEAWMGRELPGLLPRLPLKISRRPIPSDNNNSLPASGMEWTRFKIGMILDPTAPMVGEKVPTYFSYATSKLKIKECATTFPTRTTFRKGI